MDVRAYNRKVWDAQVAPGNRLTVPVGPEVTAAAQAGKWSVIPPLTRPVPREWFPALAGRATGRTSG
jgi:hypothetical protein